MNLIDFRWLNRGLRWTVIGRYAWASLKKSEERDFIPTMKKLALMNAKVEVHELLLFHIFVMCLLYNCVHFVF